jgi:hypothetical protein
VLEFVETEKLPVWLGQGRGRGGWDLLFNGVA